MDALAERIDEIGRSVVDACYCIHRELGPGLLESSYQACLIYELQNRGLRVEAELKLPLRYGHLVIQAGYRIDMLVEDLVVIENKSVENLLPLHHAQLLTYLRLSHRKLGFLINWNVPLIKNGIKRIANKL
jgi:GxxExxY protein